MVMITLSLCKDQGKHTVVLSENIEPFVSIREAISWAVSLYERIADSEKHEDIIHLMSGIRFIDNIMKHNKEIFFLYSFCCPGYNISVKVDDDDTGPIIQEVAIEPLLIFGQCENIIGKYESQYKNYNYNIQGKSIKTIMNELDKILSMFYSFEDCKKKKGIVPNSTH